MNGIGALELFEILMREQQPGLQAYLRAVVRDSAAVDDLCQETMLAAWKGLDKFDRSRPFGPWLRGIARNTLLAWRRKAASNAVLCDEAVLEQLECRLSQWQRQPGSTFDEKLEGLRVCLDRLPEPYGEAIRLHYRDDFSTDALAARLSITAEAAKKRLQRGRARLQECIERRLAASP